MRKTLALLLAAAVAGLSCSTMADAPSQARTYQLGGELDRVRLRDRPSTNGAVLGQYFSGVLVEVLEQSGDWQRVRIDDQEGFMMRKFLTAEILEDDLAYEGVPGLVDYAGQNDSLPLYDRPDSDSGILAYAEVNSLLRVLGTIDDEWLHVRCDAQQDRSVYGYVSGMGVTLPDNFSSYVIDTGAASRLLELKAEPSADCEAVGRYFSGTRVSALFDDHVNDDGWEKVRIGDTAGYAPSQDLDHSSGGTQNFYPPLSKALQDSLPLFDEFDGTEAVDTLNQNEAFSVLGVRGGRYYIQIETEEPFQYRHGYVHKEDVQDVTRSASAIWTIMADQILYFDAPEGRFIPSGFIAPAGAKAWIFGSIATEGQGISSNYIDPDDRWLSCSVEIRAYEEVFAYVPRNAVQYDQDLEYR